MRIVNVTLTIALLTVLSISSALADDTQQGDLDRQQAFSIEAQALDAALLDFSDQANVQVMVAAATIEGLETNGVEGTYTARSALAALLDSNDLQFTEVGKTVAVTPTSDQGGDSDSKNSSSAPVLMAQNQASQTQTASSRNSEGGTSIVTGRVTDARTGANLKGAKVTIEETEQWASTNDLGEFRLVNVPMGNATLTVSYLGYVGQSTVVGVRGDGVSQSFALRGGSEIEEIVVFGQRSARALALNQERTADNSTSVLSSDLIGAFPSTTIADALKRISGVSFQQDARTGEGKNIIIRGLAPDLNFVKLNGVPLPISDGVSRSPDLNTVLADTVESVTIHKSLLPSHDTAGTGGLVEVETKSPLDRPRRYAKFDVEVGERAKGFSDEHGLSAILSGTFGQSQNFGVSLAGQIRHLKNTRVGYAVSPQFGEYLPVDQFGQPTITGRSNIDPVVAFPFDQSAIGIYPSRSSYSFNMSDISNQAYTLSLEWYPARHSRLSLDLQVADRKEELASRLASIGLPASYRLLPVASLGGQERRLLEWNARGDEPGGRNSTRHDYVVAPDVRSDTETISFRGETAIARTEFRYLLGYSKGSSEENNRTNLSLAHNETFLPLGLVDPAATDPVNQVTLPYGTVDGQRIQLPMLTPAGFQFMNDPVNYRLSSASVESFFGENSNRTIDVGVKHGFDNKWLQFVDAGARFTSSRSENGAHDALRYSAFPGVTIGDLGLTFDTSDLSRIGFRGSSVFNVASLSSLRRFTSSLDGLENGSDALLAKTLIPVDPLVLGQFTEEDDLAAFVQAKLQFGKIEVIGGARYSENEVKAQVVTSPQIVDETGVFDTDFAVANLRLAKRSGRFTDVLPRILVNYRPADELIIRGGYYRTLARPRLEQLRDNENLFLVLLPFFGPNANQPLLLVEKGNPNLKPAVTDNFDLGVELYDESIGVVKIIGFYKEIKNLLEDNTTSGSSELAGVTLPDDPRFQQLPDDIFIEVVEPRNSTEPARIWGVEVQLERQLNFLPGFWGGLGVFVNYTYSESSKEERINWSRPTYDSDGEFQGTEPATRILDSVPFSQQPKNSGTFALTYSKQNFDGYFGYTFQSERIATFLPHGLSSYNDRVSSLDLRLEYRLEFGPGEYRFYFDGADLLNGTDDPTVNFFRDAGGNAPRVYTGRTYLGGRFLRFGVSGSFN